MQKRNAVIQKENQLFRDILKISIYQYKFSKISYRFDINFFENIDISTSACKHGWIQET